MSRFEGEEKETFRTRFPWVFPMIFYTVLTCVFLYGVARFSRSNLAYEQSSLINVLQRDIAECYAIEGFYPPSLEYLQSHYGFVYDVDHFMVDYTAFGSNVYPDVTVLNIENGMATTIR